jgi:hypothetical protein
MQLKFRKDTKCKRKNEEKTLKLRMNQIINGLKKKIQKNSKLLPKTKEKIQRLLFYNWRFGTHTCCNANLSKLLVY